MVVRLPDIESVGEYMLKQYRKVFVFSCTISAISFTLSIVFELLRDRANVLSFFENYAIGIACSGLLVAITTFLQFQVEFNQAILPRAVALSNLVFYLCSAIIFENDPLALESEFDPLDYDHLKTAIIRACKGNYITYLSRKNQTGFDELCMYLYLLRDTFTREKTEEDSVRAVTDPKKVLRLINMSLRVLPDGVEKEEVFEKKVELERYLEERSKREVPHP